MIFKQKVSTVDLLLLIYNILCFTYLFILAYYNRPTIDDFDHLPGQRGLFESVTFFYQHLNGRFLPNFITSILFIIYDQVQTLLFVPVIYIAAFYWIVNKIISNRHGLFCFDKNDLLKKINFIFLFLSTLIIYNFELNTFTWTIACVIYFGSILAAFILYYSLSENYNSLKKTIAIILCSVFIGCANESFAIYIVAGMMLYLIYRLLAKQAVLKDAQIKKIILSLVLIITSFLISYLAPSNGIKILNVLVSGPYKIPLSIHDLIPASATSYILLWKIILLKIPLLALMCIIFSYYKTSFKIQAWVKGGFKGILFFAVSFFILILPTTYVINYTPYRVLTPVWLLLIIACLVIATRLKFKKLMTSAAVLACIAGIIYTISIEVVPVKKYTTVYDERIKILRTHTREPDTGTVILDSLPVISFYRLSGLLLKVTDRYINYSKSRYYIELAPFDNPFSYSPYRDAEISQSASDWKNLQLKKFSSPEV